MPKVIASRWVRIATPVRRVEAIGTYGMIWINGRPSA
jgi:hypothetical protein